MKVKTSNILKFSTLSLAIFCTLMGVYFYKKENSFEKFKQKAAVENQLKQNHLDEILHKYDSVTEFVKSQNINPIPNFNLIEDKIDNYAFESLNFKNIDKQVIFLKNSIKAEKEKVVILEKNIHANEAMLGKLESLKSPSIHKNANKLSLQNITARGVKYLSDKLPKPKNKIIQELRICFTIEGNKLIKKGDKQFFIQVVNPKNQIISLENTSVELKDIKLIYSAKVEAAYQQKDIDVCTYVSLEKEKTVKGTYLINIFNDFSKIGTTTFEYN